MDFGRTITAMVTPFNTDLTVNYDMAAELADYLVSNGSDGLLITGTTGESCTLTMEESTKLYKTVKDAIGDRGAVIAGSGSNSTHEAIHLTQSAEKAGVDASLQVGPYYNKPSQAGFLHHFSEIANNTKLPIIIYNIPGRTSKNISADTIIELGKINNIVGVKEASGDLKQISKIIEETSDSFVVLSGDDFLTLPILSLGGDGVISVASHIAGEKISHMISSFIQGDVKEASATHHKLSALFNVLFITTNPAPVKTALNILGKNVGGVRLPLYKPSQKEIDQIKRVLHDMELV